MSYSVLFYTFSCNVFETCAIYLKALYEQVAAVCGHKLALPVIMVDRYSLSWQCFNIQRKACLQVRHILYNF